MRHILFSFLMMASLVGILMMAPQGYAMNESGEFQEGLAIELGVKGGANLHTTSHDSTTSGAYKSVFGVGMTGLVAADFIFTQLLGLEANFGWITRGNVLAATASPTTFTHFGFNTLALPVLLKLRFMTGSFVPYFGAGLDPYIIVSTGASTGSATATALPLTALNTFGLGIVGSLGFVYYFGDWGVTFDTRYTYSVTNVLKTGSTFAAGAGTSFNLQEISALVGFMYRIM